MGSQQASSSQRGPPKRKLASQQDDEAESSAAKRSHLGGLDGEDLLKSTLLNETEMASDLASPYLVNPRLGPKSKRRMSGTVYSQAIASQESQPPATEPSIEEQDTEEEFPSQLGLPSMQGPSWARRNQQQARKKVSTSTFDGPLAAQVCPLCL